MLRQEPCCGRLSFKTKLTDPDCVQPPVSAALSAYLKFICASLSSLLLGKFAVSVCGSLTHVTAIAYHFDAVQRATSCSRILAE